VITLELQLSAHVPLSPARSFGGAKLSAPLFARRDVPFPRARANNESIRSCHAQAARTRDASPLTGTFRQALSRRVRA
jgi:hypothetical protein